ncbi:MAG: hypothetical protein IIA65_05165, partial [Planctomycetes bacterium]|nr:hypothetical protein [Planctomycetota bacterium]
MTIANPRAKNGPTKKIISEACHPSSAPIMAQWPAPALRWASSTLRHHVTVGRRLLWGGLNYEELRKLGRERDAGAATDAGRAWLGRLGTMLLMLWVLTLIGLGAGVLSGLGTLQFAHLEAFTRYDRQQRIEIVNGRTITRISYERILRRPSSNPASAARQRTAQRVLLGVLIAG